VCVCVGQSAWPLNQFSGKQKVGKGDKKARNGKSENWIFW